MSRPNCSAGSKHQAKTAFDRGRVARSRVSPNDPIFIRMGAAGRHEELLCKLLWLTSACEVR
jgi:hypothetical protein